MKTIKISDIIANNREFQEKLKDKKKYEIVILSNLICAPIKDILEYCIRQEGIHACVTFGDYDNIVQDSKKYKDANVLIIFWELSNIIEGFHYKANIMDQKEIDDLILKIKSDIDLVFSFVQDSSLVIFNTFSTLLFNHHYLRENNFDIVCKILNEYVQKNAPKNTFLIDIDKVIAQTSIEKSVDFRFYYSSKSLYTVEFYKNYSRQIKPIILSANGKARKAVIFDCDNTLWKGIIGEDGITGIEMSGKTKNGIIFEEIQHHALELNKKGVLLGICSKNNPDDIKTVFETHPDIKLKENNFTITAINWNDKVSNLQDITKKLNIGLDSLIFIDDSNFEVNFVREKLPQIKVIQVPKKLHEYPLILREASSDFFNISSSSEDLKKVDEYQQQFKRDDERQKFENLEDYLKSLELKIELFVDSTDLTSRIAQLTQKTNQFNLTTKRYTEADIQKYMDNPDTRVFAFRVLDRFGDYGITGVCIVLFNFEKQLAIIDTFLMSCRVIGRNVEYEFFNFLVDSISKLNIKSLDATYIRTEKNQQVVNFYEKLNFHICSSSDSEKKYRLPLNKYIPTNIKYIEIDY